MNESLSARRVWIEILGSPGILDVNLRHSLRGECGLKLPIPHLLPPFYLSLSARRVWIEIITGDDEVDLIGVTLCEESVD